MLVYGDRVETADPKKRLSEINRDLQRTACLPAGMERHSKLVGAFIEAGRVLQGVADADFEKAGADWRSPASDALTGWLVDIGRAVWLSWSRGQTALEIPPAPSIGGLPAEVRLKQPEGYAHYALYPEAYAEAASDLRLSGRTQVIGIRSIGTSLAAIVAAALGAPPPFTVRPFGHPFARRIAVEPATAERLLSGDCHYLIVDEGPGLSGSSFAAVAEWLEANGVPESRIAFIASHTEPPGPQASVRTRARWARAQKAVADFGPRLPELLRRWAEPLLGPLDGDLEEISGGDWRRHRFGDESHWPPADPARERRKYLASASGGKWLLKFAGLGKVGERKLARARRLHEAGWVPRPEGLVHGFLAERWHGDARPLSHSDKPLDEIALYLGARARMFPAERQEGASLADLLDMARTNAEEAIGRDLAAAVATLRPSLPGLEARMRRVATDGSLDRHEWMRSDGLLLKADALDHCEAHDLVGCQDLAWDVAGAAVEFDLNGQETHALAVRAGSASGRPIDRDLLRLMLIAYPAFRLGLAELALQSAPPGDSARVLVRRNAYLVRLRQALTDGTVSPPQHSAIRKPQETGVVNPAE